MSGRKKHDLDEVRARNPLADVAGGYVQLRRAAGRLVGPCPICGGRVTSQRFEVIEKTESWVCAVCPDGGDVIRLVEKVEGCSFLHAVERLGGREVADPAQMQRLINERESKRLARELVAEQYREAERKRLWKTWTSALDIHGTHAADYLAGRALQLPPRCPGLRYLPRAPYFHGEEINERGRESARQIHSGPAMLAAFIRPDGHFGGLHMTWLTADATPVKIELTDPDSGEILNAKKMRGSKIGAHICVAPTPLSPRRLVIGEGIETVLAVYTAFAFCGRDVSDIAFWAAGDLGNLAGRATETISHPTLKRPNGRAQSLPGPFPDPDDSGLSIPNSVDELILLGDGDSEPVLTKCAMERAARRYTKPGRAIRIVFAPAGLDFNDLLKAAA